MTPPRLRPATPDDAAAIRRIYAPFVEETAVSFEADPPTVDEMRDRIESKPPAYPWLVAEGGSGVVGYAYAGRFASRAAYRWAVECSVYVAPDAHRGGVGGALYTGLLDLLARQGYRTAYAGMTVPNEASAGLHSAMGFTPVGTFENAGYKRGSWHDVQWWQRGLGDEATADTGQPAPPRPLPELADAEVAAALTVE
ncbi:arsinothricin resistance N-acetyltransferase ArsN1 family B [Halomarina salina]|uniref:Arsinothricin resistance N-acetyltransferase ArsN1 family B n=1 Tax=Halomarina salina TaxID=1872699 RepID=A0ABD5RLP2_9EURY